MKSIMKFMLGITLIFLALNVTNVIAFEFFPGGGDPTPDDEDPVVGFLWPTQGARFDYSTYIQAYAGDNVEVLRVEFFIDGIYKGQDSSSPYKWFLNIEGYSEGNHIFKVKAIDSSANSAEETITCYIDRHVSKRYAVIVGISDYASISDLSYCDEDATDWYNHLTGSQMDFDQVKVYGDGHTSNYPKYDGDATENNVKQALINMVNKADEDDVIAFISSGHGGGDTSSHLCMYDSSGINSGDNGNLRDVELKSILEDAIAAKIFLFFDHCASGGFEEELLAMTNKETVYCTTTCTASGKGYEDSDNKNGAWTYCFLEETWIEHYGRDGTRSLEEIFFYAWQHYDFVQEPGDDVPQEIDGNNNEAFSLR